MKSKSICFLMRTPPSRRDYERFGIEIFKQRGYEVTFLDSTQILNPEYLSGYKLANPMEYEKIIYIKQRKEFYDFFKKNRDVIVIDCAGRSFDNLYMYRIFKKFNICYISFCTNVPIPPAQDKSLFKRLTDPKYFLKIFRKGSTKYFKNLWFKFLYSLSFNIQPPSYILIGGYKHSRMSLRADKSARFIWAHTLDYDLYLVNKDRSAATENYCVFLDEYLPYHPDYLISVNSRIEIDPDKYYSDLNGFFDWFEYKFKIQVIIAAHPRARYDLKPECFKKRIVKKGQTNDLVFKAKYVFLHASTSVNFAVLYKKPVVFITSDLLENTHYRVFIANFAREFNKRPLNINRKEEYDIEKEFQVDENVYQNYILNYIKVPGTPEKPFWDIVVDYLLTQDNNGSLCLKN